jgi:hypothetical protein
VVVTDVHICAEGLNFAEMIRGYGCTMLAASNEKEIHRGTDTV